jgi:hypothetical protein
MQYHTSLIWQFLLHWNAAYLQAGDEQCVSSSSSRSSSNAVAQRNHGCMSLTAGIVRSGGLAEPTGLQHVMQHTLPHGTLSSNLAHLASRGVCFFGSYVFCLWCRR